MKYFLIIGLLMMTSYSAQADICIPLWWRSATDVQVEIEAKLKGPLAMTIPCEDGRRPIDLALENSTYSPVFAAIIRNFELNLDEETLHQVEKMAGMTRMTITEISYQEQLIIKDLLVFWRDNMVTTTPDNNCQRQIKTRLSTNRTLISFISDYYSFDFDIFPISDPFDIFPTSDPTDLNEPDINIREEFETLEFIWNSCEIEEETPEKTDFQNEAESMIREMLTYWIDNMIPLENGNSCQRHVKHFTEGNETLNIAIIYSFWLSDSKGDISLYFNSEEHFLNNMRQNLNILQNNSCL